MISSPLCFSRKILLRLLLHHLYLNYIQISAAINNAYHDPKQTCHEYCCSVAVSQKAMKFAVDSGPINLHNKIHLNSSTRNLYLETNQYIMIPYSKIASGKRDTDKSNKGIMVA